WRDDHQFLEGIVERRAIERLGDRPGELLFFEPMPVGLFNGAARRADALHRAAWPIRALFAGRRIVAAVENILDDEVERLRRSAIAQEERLLAVADEDECIVADREVGHGALLRTDMTPRRCGAVHSVYAPHSGRVPSSRA